MRNLYKLEDWTDIKFIRLGEILIEAGKVNLFHLSMVLDIQRFKKMPMGEILIAMKVINQDDLRQALKIQKVIQKNNHD